MATAFTVKAQDSLSLRKKSPERKHEVGVSIITPLIIVLGATDYNERFSNLTYRRFLSDKHAVKSFVGIGSAGIVPNNPRTVSATNTSTVYFINNRTTPSNFQVGFGYEYILGNKKLKHVFGADLVYNNKFLKEEFFYYQEIDSVGVNGKRFHQTTQLDTGSYVKTNNYDKIGFNLSYSLRYDISKRWVITASGTLSSRYYRQKVRNTYNTGTELEYVGLVSDVSLFFKF